MGPLLQALKDLGGSAKAQEARKKIIENDIETAKKMLEDSYKEECEYNEHRKRDE